jgi:multidrug efflux pump subunit AcrA (membrane-fusion protein)
LAPGFGIEGSLRLGLAADPEDRTLDLFVTPESLQSWARNGVSAQLEIVTDVSAMAMPAIPLGAVQRDGLTAVVFQRDPFDPQQAIRVEVTLGRDDGRWVEVLDGVDMGNEIVLDGAFQLLLASSGSIQQGGHFHSDGTFHEGED